MKGKGKPNMLSVTVSVSNKPPKGLDKMLQKSMGKGAGPTRKK